MDDMKEIEKRMLSADGSCDDRQAHDAPMQEGVVDQNGVAVIENPSQTQTEQAQDYGDAPATVALVAPAAFTAAQKAMNIASDKVGGDKKVKKYAEEIENIADGMLKNQLETERVKIKKEASKNKVERAKIANELYEEKQKGIRLRKEAKHESKMQKARHKAERTRAYWEAHKSTLEQYGMHEGNSKVSCGILLWLDGVKSFFIGLGKVSDAIVKALRWFLIFAAITAIIMVIPVTRNWILSLLGFIKK